MTALGGIFYAQSEFKASGVAKVIDGELGSRTTRKESYKWSEVISALWSASLCGGDFLEDVGETGKTVRLAPGTRVPSADTVGRTIKELATDSIEYTSKAGNTYAFNPCEKLNGLLLDVAMQLGLLKGGQVVDVDFDHVFTPCKKADAKYSYKKDFGYFPCVYSINGLIAGVENRDGNTPDMFGERYVYRCILTDDWEHTEKKIIELYNKRGGREKDFDMLNNDFMWKHLPCSWMKENAVFMLLMAMCKNFYTCLIAKLAALFFGLRPTSRVKSFVYHFITVPAKWVRRSRTWQLNFYTDRPYDKLQFL